MAGDGYYNAHSPQQGAIAATAEDALRRAVRSLPDPLTASVIADYGCSQGRNSIGPVKVLLDELGRRAGEPRPWSVVHNDVPGNDWTTFFATVFGDDGYLSEHEAVFPSAIGRTFYEQLLPDSSVAVGWSGTSVLWLSGRPDVGPDNLFSPIATGEDRRRWAAAAADDWRTFLGHRSRELVPGGRLVVSSLQASDAYPPFLHLIRRGVRAAVEAGTLTAAEADAMTVPTYQRTKDEIEAPFADDGLGLVVDEHTSFTAPDPAYAASPSTASSTASPTTRRPRSGVGPGPRWPPPSIPAEGLVGWPRPSTRCSPPSARPWPPTRPPATAAGR